MKRIDLRALLKQVEPHRNEVAEVDGISMPKSAAMLLSGLATETAWNVRFELHTSAISECGWADNAAAAVKLAQMLHQELRSSTSLMILSRALVENSELEAGLLRAKEALELSIQSHGGVNNAAGNLVRLTVKTGSVEAVNQAMEALIDSTDAPRKWDCVLDIDWCDDAEALGADMELISWIRAVAEIQMPLTERERERESRELAKQKFREKRS